MNKANVLAVADAIERHAFPKLGFNMGAYVEPSGYWTPDRSGHNCKTVACVAGWTIAVKEGHAITSWSWSRRIAAGNFLGLDMEEADCLFNPTDLSDWESIKPKQAVATLRRLARTGKVSWKA